MLEMEIESIRVSLMSYQRVVILRVKGSNRYLPIWIGSAEADAIALRLQDVEVPRPLTHDLLGNVIAALGASASGIVVSDLTDDTFYAKVLLQSNGSSYEVDSRPSDAIALAVRQGYFLMDPKGDKQQFTTLTEAEEFVTEQRKYHDDFSPQISKVCPIFADEAVVEKAGVEMDEETGAARLTREGDPKPVNDEELKRLSAFTEFINELNLDDLGKEEKSSSSD